MTPYLQDNQLTLLKHEPSIPREDLGLPKHHPVVSYVFGFKNGDESYTVEFCVNAENNTQFNVVSKKHWESGCVLNDLSTLNSTQEAIEEIVTRLLGFSNGNN